LRRNVGREAPFAFSCGKKVRTHRMAQIDTRQSCLSQSVVENRDVALGRVKTRDLDRFTGHGLLLAVEILSTTAQARVNAGRTPEPERAKSRRCRAKYAWCGCPDGVPVILFIFRSIAHFS
jgi:hypothetical protein